MELPVIQGGLEIGVIDLKNQSISVSPNYIKYTCSQSGNCCTRFHIPVTEFDIERIQEHGYDLFQIIEDNSPYLRFPKSNYGSVEKNFNIKRKPFTNECTFLDNGICSIHEFKPYGCRIFPFQFHFLDNELVKVTIHESNYCPSVKPSEINNSSNEFYLQFLLQTLLNEIKYREEYYKK